jgi:3D (Asp-Asp-Asp) domain-containing protein
VTAGVAVLLVTVTAYTCWHGHPTASGVRPTVGMVAVSHDLEQDLGLRFGDALYVEGVGCVRFQDRMPRRWKRRVDIFLPSRRAALEFGRRRGQLSTMCP